MESITVLEENNGEEYNIWKKYGKKTVKPTVRNNAPKGPQMPEEWLYLAEDEITPAQIYGLFAEEKSWKAEYWEEAEVVEIELPEAGSVDMENLGGASEDEAMEAYMKDRSLHTAYAVTIRPDDFEEAEKVMEYISSHLGGYFCGDTDDFQPEIRAEG